MRCEMKSFPMSLRSWDKYLFMTQHFMTQNLFTSLHIVRLTPSITLSRFKTVPRHKLTLQDFLNNNCPVFAYVSSALSSLDPKNSQDLEDHEK
jgi:hypothetical protein